MTTSSLSRRSTDHFDLTLRVMTEHITAILTDRRTKPIFSTSTFEIRLFMHRVRRYLDGEKVDDEVREDFSLMMRAWQATSKRKIRTPEVTRQDLRDYIELAELLYTNRELTRKQLPVLKRFLACLVYIKDECRPPRN